MVKKMSMPKKNGTGGKTKSTGKGGKKARVATRKGKHC